jgi:hypothetical protein
LIQRSTDPVLDMELDRAEGDRALGGLHDLADGEPQHVGQVEPRPVEICAAQRQTRQVVAETDLGADDVAPGGARGPKERLGGLDQSTVPLDRLLGDLDQSRR